MMVKRELCIKKLFFILLILPFSFDAAWAQDELKVISGESSNTRWLHYSDASNSLYNYLSNQAYDLLRQRSTEVFNLQTRSDWERRQSEIRETLQEIVGPFPEKTSLNAQVIRRIKKEDFKVEHIIYESQPGFHVTASLFIPDMVNNAPAILYMSGHSLEGYRTSTYQHVILNLVKKGFIVFAIDPVGQGERLEYLDTQTGTPMISSTREHSYTGVQTLITGSSQAKYMIWDGIRAVDYLLTRPEVDPERIGITGRSGGGTQTAFIAALDERIHAAAPEAFITNYSRLLQSIGPQDAEQNLFHGISKRLDHPDYLVVRAPKPTLLIATTEDFFSIQGARESASEVTAIFDAYEESDHFQMAEDSGGHQSTRKNRETMYAFFQKHLDNPGNSNDEEVIILNEDEIRVTPTGQLSTSLAGETVFSLNRKEVEERVFDLQRSRENLDRHLPYVLEAARDLSGFQPPADIGKPVFTGRIQRDGYVIEKYFVGGEGDYIIPFLLMVPEESNNKAVLYLHPSGKSVEASAGGEIEWYLQQGYTILSPDLIGVGEMGPGVISNYMTSIKDFDPVSFDVWSASVLIGRSITGIRAGDVVRLSHLLLDEFNQQEIYGVARRDMAPVMLHATAFNPSISRVALIEPYSSYRSIVMNRFYDPGFHLSTVAGALSAYDLPDLAASLAPRKLLVAGVTDGAGDLISPDDLNIDIDFIQKVYEDRGAGDALIVTAGQVQMDNLYSLLLDWMN